jgi:hypothetical protein
MLERVRSSFRPEDHRSEALLEVTCGFINAVHGVEGRADYTFALMDLGQGTRGVHDQGFEVLVNTLATNRVIATVHEIGHAIDGVFLNSVEMGCAVSSYPTPYASDIAATAGVSGGLLLSGWLEAVQRSNNYQALRAVQAMPNLPEKLEEAINYLLSVREMWARSYELFIARRHPDTVLSAEMDRETHERAEIAGSVVYNYWQGNDFDQIDQEIEQVFRRIGWLM